MLHRTQKLRIDPYESREFLASGRSSLRLLSPISRTLRVCATIDS
jgi:hypothetical protein